MLYATAMLWNGRCQRHGILTQADLRPFRGILLVMDDEDIARVRVSVCESQIIIGIHFERWATNETSRASDSTNGHPKSPKAKNNNNDP
jgi:hypothetical protein